MADWFKNGFQRFGITPPASIDPELGQSPPRGLDKESQQLLEEALPRGLPFGREQQNRSERAQWGGVEEIGALKWKPTFCLASSTASVSVTWMTSRW